MMVVSLVNPHDIVFWPAWSIWRRRAVNLAGLPSIGATPSQDHVPTVEPSVLAEYRTQYGKAYGPASIIQWLYRRSPERYRRFYCALLKQADAHLGTLLSCLDETGLSESTHIVFSSDHGEMLGSHGGLHQKWYNAFEETLRVPLIIRKASQADSPPTVRRDLSTHLDLVPTLMGLAQIPSRECDQPLPGRDLFGSATQDTTYFLTSDRILEGGNQEGVVGRRFPIVRWLWPLRYVGMEGKRTSVEAIVSTCQMHSQRPQTWKLIRYFNPNLPQVQPSDEWSLFHLDVDPNERHDLANSPHSAELLKTLKARLEHCRAALGGPRSNHVSGAR